MRLSGWALVVLLAVTGAACHKTQAKAPEPPPPLAVPLPPPRTPIPVSIEPPPEIETPPATEIPAPAGTKAPAARTAGSTPPTQPPTTTAPPPTPPENAPPVLQPSNMGDLEKRARALLAEAQKNLAGVMLNNLSEGARSQYFIALSFTRMAEQALQAKNFPYATQLASNANNLARLLIKK